MSNDGYNGWSNQETWAAALHMENDYGLYSQLWHMIGEVKGKSEDDEPNAIRDEVAERMESIMEPYLDPAEYVEQFGDVALSDWVKGPWLILSDVGDPGRVNWDEIAKSWLTGI